jgi:hypothetical protein
MIWILLDKPLRILILLKWNAKFGLTKRILKVFIKSFNF